MIFIIVLLSLLVMYAITVSLMRYMRNVKTANLIFFELTFGIYLVRSGQVTLAPRKSLYSGLIIIGVALFMMVLNLIFDTSFFGLSLLGKHNIYGNVLVESSYLSALIYFAGLTVILLLGYACSRFFEKRKIG